MDRDVLVIKNVLNPENRKVVVCMPGKDVTYDAFSAFIEENPNNVPCQWNILSGDLKTFAVDDHTMTVIKSGILIDINSEYCKIILNKFGPAECMYCKSNITEGYECNVCNFAVYCSKKCAEEEWKCGHNMICKMIAKSAHHHKSINSI